LGKLFLEGPYSEVKIFIYGVGLRIYLLGPKCTHLGKILDNGLSVIPLENRLISGWAKLLEQGELLALGSLVIMW
jgi:hypothetical protein